MNAHASEKWLPLAGVVALWVPAMIAASYEWGHGEYYAYGWFVPPAALYLLIRRWNPCETVIRIPPRIVVLPVLLLLLPWFTGLRILGYADPLWRLPTGLLGLTATVGGHALIAASRGWRTSLSFGWITLLLLSALPWPSVVESGIVHALTRGVVNMAAEVFHWLGKPVEVAGDRLVLHGQGVEVTDGCSGVRSFQSFLMATWFFAELQRLRLKGALILLTCACGVAFAVNAARTYALAEIRFTKGETAFHQAHDLLGLLAFGVAGLLFFLISGWLAENSHPRKVKITKVRS